MNKKVRQLSTDNKAVHQQDVDAKKIIDPAREFQGCELRLLQMC